VNAFRIEVADRVGVSRKMADSGAGDGPKYLGRVMSRFSSISTAIVPPQRSHQARLHSASDNAREPSRMRAPAILWLEREALAIHARRGTKQAVIA